MSDILSRSLSSAHSHALALVDRAKAGMGGIASGGMIPYSGMLQANVEGSMAQIPTLQTHQEQYRHFIGRTFTAIRPIAQRIAGQPLRIARWSASNSGKAIRPHRDRVPEAFKEMTEDLDLIESHPLLDAINNPNPVLRTRWALLYVTVASLECTGKNYWWFVPDEDGRLNIWPVPASWIEPVHTEDTLYHHWRMRAGGRGEWIDIERDAIAYTFYPDPSNPLGAISPLSAQARTVVADEHITEAQRRAFINGIWPGIALTVGRMPDIQGKPGERPFLTHEQRRQLIYAVKQYYRGVLSYNEPLILDGLIQDVKRISSSNREMDFMQSGNFTKSRIDQGFGVNPIINGEVEGANRASAAAADDLFCQFTVNPKIELISQSLTAWAAPLFSQNGEVLVIYLEPCKAKDPDQEQAEEDGLWAKSAITVNEIRRRHGYAPLEPDVGDVTYIAAGMMPVPLTPEGKRAVAEAEPEPKPAAKPANEKPSDTEGQESEEAKMLLPRWKRRRAS